MQTTGSTSDKSSSTGAPPPSREDRDEDSGLHDIRSMASSTKMRISSKRITTTPPVDDDILASSSAGWKAVALPEPAKMVSLPELDQLPPVEEVKSERKSKKELKAERTSASKIAREAIAVETAPVSPVQAAKPVEAPSVTPIIGARIAQQQKKSKAGLYALVGTGLAAAAGVGWYVSTQMDSKSASGEQVAISQNAAAVRAEEKQQAPVAATPPAAAPGSVAAPTVEPIAEPEATATPDLAIATGAAADDSKDDSKASDEGAASKRGAKGTGKKKAEKADKDAAPPADKKDAPKEAPKPDPKTTTVKPAEGGEGEPSFDALLKEAGVSQDKKPQKVALEKKSLSGGDIKKGMSAVGGKAQACYQGTQGTAQVKLTVSPDGSVQKVSVSGVFAGTPVGACVEAAVKSATFPPWDGGPQSFGYSYLLAE